MSTETEQHVINDYLDRLERAAQVLAPDRRIDLLVEIREHIDTARSADELEGEAGLRSLLDRLGTPEEIVAAAADGAQPFQPGQFSAPPRRSLALELWAVLMLTAGSVVLPLVGWLIGVVLLWSSDRWRTREKVLGTLVVPGGLGVVVLAGLAGLFAVQSSTTCVSSASAADAGNPGPVGIQPVGIQQCTGGSGTGLHVLAIGIAVIVLLAAVIVPIYLLQLARGRAQTHAEIG